ncbi:MAG: hypothetical protein M1831_007191 [Alyxoria varia]|nr:MAG: hypothetical protein M1831_007191 [Alyxoria varia]
MSQPPSGSRTGSLFSLPWLQDASNKENEEPFELRHKPDFKNPKLKTAIESPKNAAPFPKPLQPPTPSNSSHQWKSAYLETPQTHHKGHQARHSPIDTPSSLPVQPTPVSGANNTQAEQTSSLTDVKAMLSKKYGLALSNEIDVEQLSQSFTSFMTNLGPRTPQITPESSYTARTELLDTLSPPLNPQTRKRRKTDHSHGFQAPQQLPAQGTQEITAQIRSKQQAHNPTPETPATQLSGHEHEGNATSMDSPQAPMDDDMFESCRRRVQGDEVLRGFKIHLNYEETGSILDLPGAVLKKLLDLLDFWGTRKKNKWYNFLSRRYEDLCMFCHVMDKKRALDPCKLVQTSPFQCETCCRMKQQLCVAIIDGVPHVRKARTAEDRSPTEAQFWLGDD